MPNIDARVRIEKHDVSDTGIRLCIRGHILLHVVWYDIFAFSILKSETFNFSKS